jgi:hypothetical protein
MTLKNIGVFVDTPPPKERSGSTVQLRSLTSAAPTLPESTSYLRFARSIDPITM